MCLNLVVAAIDGEYFYDFYTQYYTIKDISWYFRRLIADGFIKEELNLSEKKEIEIWNEAHENFRLYERKQYICYITTNLHIFITPYDLFDRGFFVDKIKHVYQTSKALV